MHIKEEEGELWFNKGCSSDRIATVIKADGKNQVYMYLGGGSVDNEQSNLMGGLVARCKSWRWVGLLYAAMLILALCCNNNLGKLSTDLVLSKENTDCDLTSFYEIVDKMWEDASECCGDLVTDSTWPHSDLGNGLLQAKSLVEQLEKLCMKKEIEVTEFLKPAATLKNI